MRRMRTLSLTLAALALAATAGAEVTRVDVARRMDLGFTGYEKIVGTIHFAVDPKDPRNQPHRRSRQGAAQCVRPGGVFLRSLHPQTQGAARQRRGAGGHPQPRQQDGVERLQPRRLAGSGDRKRSRRPFPDALRLHHRLGRVGVRRRGSADGDADPCSGRHRSRQADHRRGARRSSRRTRRRPSSRSPISRHTTRSIPNGADSSLSACPSPRLLDDACSAVAAAPGASSGHRSRSTLASCRA